MISKFLIKYASKLFNCSCHQHQSHHQCNIVFIVFTRFYKEICHNELLKGQTLEATFFLLLTYMICVFVIY